jgi:SAM-dependent methyltransferase
VLTILGAMAWVSGDVNLTLDLKIALPVYALGLFLGCMFCHGELSLMKPAPRYLTGFYLMVALGGALGALVVSILAPLLLPGEFELQGALVACALLLAWQLRREAAWLPLAAGVVALGLAAVSIRQIWETVDGNLILKRNFYGALRVRDTGPFTAPGTLRRLIHGVIQHGEQYIEPGREFEALTYYGPTSGVGIALDLMDRPGRRIGVIGLGAGTLAAYGREGDLVRFYEINPQVVDIARRAFTYLSRTPAKVEVAVGDARLVLDREPPQRFDLLAVDAFSSDAIPVHLLTRQAMEVYLRHLAPGGVIAFHVTNRYLDLPPVVNDIAAALGLHATLVSDDPEEGSGYTMSRTDWVLVAREAEVLAQPPIAAVAKTIASDGSRLWTDDSNNLLRAIKR